MKTDELFTDKVNVKKLVIMPFEHSDMRLTEEIGESIKREIGCANKGHNKRITSYHLERRAVVVGCIKTLTKHGWRSNSRS